MTHGFHLRSRFAHRARAAVAPSLTPTTREAARRISTSKAVAIICGDAPVPWSAPVRGSAPPTRANIPASASMPRSPRSLHPAPPPAHSSPWSCLRCDRGNSHTRADRVSGRLSGTDSSPSHSAERSTPPCRRWPPPPTRAPRPEAASAARCPGDSFSPYAARLTRPPVGVRAGAGSAPPSPDCWQSRSTRPPAGSRDPLCRTPAPYQSDA
jgi:hypothetical protein